MSRFASPMPHLIQRPCSHFDARPDDTEINLLVIHNISLPAGHFCQDPRHSYVDALFSGTLDCRAHPSFADLQGLRVAAHCVIWRDGQIFQYVPFEMRGWHAGQSSFAGQPRCNDYSIGIELEGTDEIPYNEQQYSSLLRLTRSLLQQYPAITLERIVGHCDIAPGRKTDPGAAFDWQRYKQALKENKA
ncbi:1,6-anhydro-N-acetylmuramyl-L-alanine amidase AmpD [Rheinheimera sp. UJ63]|uniref:1,6-anhydro-N-acetylmuramyl-L-alanine amidase AmpD n=1 Tax=Rheinheimera sp. UJ63 TaxID=2910157 RepID=UPI001F42019A|nr:1,6-anhydro-N-acetylmuramyl-L-alanine amidase AmpD [Rheinheimera sp. UJ63]MCF4010503.1 1,6-anhydro-N-acetylmuramyl-L-alanine amidase AmpD [Rheinheimera sp. UJ63]